MNQKAALTFMLIGGVLGFGIGLLTCDAPTKAGTYEEQYWNHQSFEGGRSLQQQKNQDFYEQQQRDANQPWNRKPC